VFAAFLEAGLERPQAAPCEVSLAGGGTRVRLLGAGSADGKVLQMAALDITELCAARQQAELARRDLQRRLERLAAQLEAAGKELASIRRTLTFTE
jgi:hypothetical protein